MKRKTQIELDADLLTEDNIITKTYKNRQGETITKRFYRIESIEQDNEKMLYENETSKLMQIGFCTFPVSKEERLAGKESPILGNQTYWKNKESTYKQSKPAPFEQQEIPTITLNDEPGNQPLPF